MADIDKMKSSLKTTMRDVLKCIDLNLKGIALIADNDYCEEYDYIYVRTIVAFCYRKGFRRSIFEC